MHEIVHVLRDNTIAISIPRMHNNEFAGHSLRPNEAEVLQDVNNLVAQSEDGRIVVMKIMPQHLSELVFDASEFLLC